MYLGQFDSPCNEEFGCHDNLRVETAHTRSVFWLSYLNDTNIIQPCRSQPTGPSHIMSNLSAQPEPVQPAPDSSLTETIVVNWSNAEAWFSGTQSQRIHLQHNPLHLRLKGLPRKRGWKDSKSQKHKGVCHEMASSRHVREAEPTKSDQCATLARSKQRQYYYMC